MRLAIEATKLLGERRGIGRYVRNLLCQFVQQRPDLVFTMYVAHRDDAAAVLALFESDLLVKSAGPILPGEQF